MKVKHHYEIDISIKLTPQILTIICYTGLGLQKQGNDETDVTVLLYYNCTKGRYHLVSETPHKHHWDASLICLDGLFKFHSS